MQKKEITNHHLTTTSKNKSMITEGNKVYDIQSGELLGTVDRSNVTGYDDSSVRVVLACGHKEEYFITNLSDAEYIKRTLLLKKISLINP